MSDKINSKHLERIAYVYIRQSTLQQVRNNVESGRRQYALEDRAKALGFKSVVVIDEDLGISGTGSRERPGFGRLLLPYAMARWEPFSLWKRRDWPGTIEIGTT